MPIINVSVSDAELHQTESDVGGVCLSKERAVTEIAERLTESTVRVLKKDRELVVVRVTDSEPANWFVSGKPLVSTVPICEVEIKITEGSNSSEEVSTWVREVYETMKQSFGELASPNYISVQEVKSEFWGYNGLTQFGRKKWSV